MLLISGPGNYNPPIDNTPGQLPGQPGSGQQLIKHYLIHAKEQQHQKQMSEAYLRQMIMNQNMNSQLNQNMNSQMASVQLTTPKQPEMALQQSNSILQHRNSQPMMNRRQDLLTDVLPSAAVGALASGLTPISIFSNLLNAYATLDSKHDITGKLVKQATDFFNPSPQEEPAEEPMEPKDTSTEGHAYDAIVVDADENSQPPVRSNVDPNQPLRPKPPSDGVFRVTPAPQFQSHGKYGVQNPNFYSYDSHGPTTESYGPDDFIVETVKLDKQFFHQLFTSKPTLLGSNSDQLWPPRKRSRKNEDRADLLPGFTQDYQNLPSLSRELPALSQIEQELPDSNQMEWGQHTELPDKSLDWSQTARATLPDNIVELPEWRLDTEVKVADPAEEKTHIAELPDELLQGVELSPLQMMAMNYEKTPKSTTTTTEKPATTTHKTSDVPKIINSVKTFTRYSIPAEVKISHTLNAE